MSVKTMNAIATIQDLGSTAVVMFEHERARHFLLSLEQITGHVILEPCGSCGSEHPFWFKGDCRDNENRF